MSGKPYAKTLIVDYLQVVGFGDKYLFLYVHLHFSTMNSYYQELGAGDAAWTSGVLRVRPHTDLGQNGEGLWVQHQELLILSAQDQAGHSILISQVFL